jgi:sortase A
MGGVAMILVGVLILAYGTVTVVWQDPITALTGSRNQERVSDELDAMFHGMRPVAKKAQARARIAHEAKELNVNTAPGHALGRLSIPAIDSEFTMVQGTDDVSLQSGPGHYVETPLPGARGNWTVGVAGHRTTYQAPFRHVDSLQAGDKVVVRMPYARFRYEVYETRVVRTTRPSSSASRSTRSCSPRATRCTAPRSASSCTPGCVTFARSHSLKTPDLAGMRFSYLTSRLKATYGRDARPGT